jgi:type IV secretory pathway VirJ component
MTPFLAAYRKLAAATPATLPAPPGALTDLPLIEVPATGADPRFAILLSGDGGWAGLDKDVAAALAARGIPVVGWDSLRYFWTARTPAGVAADLDRVLRFYAAHWERSRAIVIGYSQGADVLPFALNRLPAATRALVAGTALLGLGEKASFEFHVANWIGADDASALPIRPEAEKLPADTTLCLYGADETDSLCPRLGGAVRVVKLPGGHHFDGDYARLAEIIIGSGR